jgi:hypothetical protein
MTHAEIVLAVLLGVVLLALLSLHARIAQVEWRLPLPGLKPSDPHMEYQRTLSLRLFEAIAAATGHTQSALLDKMDGDERLPDDFLPPAP